MARTRTYAEALSRYQRIAGIDVLSDDESEFFNAYFNRNIRRAWDAYEWPTLCLIEERTANASNVIAYEQSGETEIGDVFGVYRTDPFGASTAKQIGYQLTADGIQFWDVDVPDPVYVYFRKACPDYAGSNYNAGTAYAAGDQAYYETTGDYYKCILTSTGNLPTNTTYWERLTVPYELFEYTCQASYGDWLKSNEQHQNGAFERQMAEDILATEIEKFSRQQQFRPLRRNFFTHGTEQLRQ
jgi:hypothetical protein